MKKISGILPSNARITSVDLSQSGTSRPGAPGFGRKVGRSSGATQVGLTTAEKAVAIHKAMDGARKTARNVDIATRSADKFFTERLNKPSIGDSFKNDPIYQKAEQLYNVNSEIAQAEGGPLLELAPREPLAEMPIDPEEHLPSVSAQGLPSELDLEDEPDAPAVGRYLDVEV